METTVLLRCRLLSRVRKVGTFSVGGSHGAEWCWVEPAPASIFVRLALPVSCVSVLMQRPQRRLLSKCLMDKENQDLVVRLITRAASSGLDASRRQSRVGVNVGGDRGAVSDGCMRAGCAADYDGGTGGSCAPWASGDPARTPSPRSCHLCILDHCRQSRTPRPQTFHERELDTTTRLHLHNLDRRPSTPSTPSTPPPRPPPIHRPSVPLFPGPTPPHTASSLEPQTTV